MTAGSMMSEDSSGDEENPYWASFKGDTSSLDEAQLKVIEDEEKDKPTALNHEHWSKLIQHEKASTSSELAEGAEGSAIFDAALSKYYSQKEHPFLHTWTSIPRFDSDLEELFTQLRMRTSSAGADTTAKAPDSR